MFAPRFVPLGLMFVVTFACGSVFAQSLATPASNVGGRAGYELSRIYSDSIGRGYSAGDINRVTLDNTRVSAGRYVVQSSITDSGSPFSAGRRPTKPFSTASPSPTVSPYLNMFEDLLDDTTNSQYITNVRPQLQQQRFNQQLRLQQQQLERRVQQIAAAPAYSVGGSEYQVPTGHVTVFFNTGRFYPLNLRR